MSNRITEETNIAFAFIFGVIFCGVVSTNSHWWLLAYPPFMYFFLWLFLKIFLWDKRRIFILNTTYDGYHQWEILKTGVPVTHYMIFRVEKIDKWVTQYHCYPHKKANRKWLKLMVCLKIY